MDVPQSVQGMSPCPVCDPTSNWQQNLADVIARSIADQIKEVLHGINDNHVNLLYQVQDLLHLVSEKGASVGAEPMINDAYSAEHRRALSDQKKADESKSRSPSISAVSNPDAGSQESAVILPGCPINVALNLNMSESSRRGTQQSSHTQCPTLSFFSTSHEEIFNRQVSGKSTKSRESAGAGVSMGKLEKDCDDELISQSMTYHMRQTSEKSYRRMTMAEFTDAADSELVARSSIPSPSSSPFHHRVGTHGMGHALNRVGHLFLSVYGLTPSLPKHSDLIHRLTVSLVLVLASSHAVFLSVAEQNAKYEYLPTVCLALGSLFGIMDLLWFDFRLRFEQLSDHIEFMGCTAVWHQKSFRRFMIISILSGGTACVKVTLWVHPACQETSRGKTDDVHSLLHLISFFVFYGALTVITYCQSHVDLALEFCVESYSMEYTENHDHLHAICSWNTIQAITRRTGRTTENSFLALITSSLVLFVWSAIQAIDISKVDDTQCTALHFGWMVSPVLLAMYAICCAAALTRRLSRAPSFINSVRFEEERHNLGTACLVQHMRNSDAGLFVKGACVTPHVAIKLVYIMGVVCFTLISQNFRSL